MDPNRWSDQTCTIIGITVLVVLVLHNLPALIIGFCIVLVACLIENMR